MSFFIKHGMISKDPDIVCMNHLTVLLVVLVVLVVDRVEVVDRTEVVDRVEVVDFALQIH